MKTTITGRGVQINDSIREAVDSLLSKNESFLQDPSVKVNVELVQKSNNSGLKNGLAVEITITMPNALVRVEEIGEDFYVIIDTIDPILRRRLVRYQERDRLWSGKQSWKVAEREQLEKEIEHGEEDSYADVTEDVPPVITRFKQFSQNSPMHPAEAIERMELLGHEAFLFKNIESDKYAMVYKRFDGTYGLVEPKDV